MRWGWRLSLTPAGEILTGAFMEPPGLSSSVDAEAMGEQTKHVKALCNDMRHVTAATALIRARVFSSSPDVWLNARRRRDFGRLSMIQKNRYA